MAQNSAAPVMERMQPEILMRSLHILMAWSGKGGALLRRPPLRTGLAGFPRTSAQASPGGLAGSPVVEGAENLCHLGEGPAERGRAFGHVPGRSWPD